MSAELILPLVALAVSVISVTVALRWKREAMHHRDRAQGRRPRHEAGPSHPR